MSTPNQVASGRSHAGNGVPLSTEHRAEVPPVDSPSLDRRVPTSGARGLNDLGRFRLNQDFASGAPVKKIITTVPVRKPHKQEFIFASAERTFQTLTYTWKEENRTFLVEPGLASEFSEGLVATLLVGCMNRQGVFFFWPISLQQGDEPWNDWHKSAHAAMVLAKNSWIRVTSNRALGAYEAHQAQAVLAEPDWPELSLEDLLRIAFRDYVIDHADHPILKRLRGEV
jgi:hypothetical protein